MPEKNQQLAVLSIGRELMIGHTVDTNAAYFANEVLPLGWRVAEIRVIDDEIASIVQTLNELAKYAIILITGGLGPTPDDLTRQAIADFAQVKLEFHPELWAIIEQRFQSFHRVPTDSNQLQAYLPIGAAAIPNPVGTAPGIDLVVAKNGQRTRLFAMPGVPSEMKTLFAQTVAPILRELSTQKFFMKRWKLCGIGESAVGEIIRNAAPLSPEAEIGTTVDNMVVTVRIMAAAEKESIAREKCRSAQKFLSSQLKSFFFCEDNESPAMAIIRVLRERGQKLAFAESCTGGLLSAAIVEHPGASAVFQEAVIVYSNAAKKRLGDLPEEILREYGAVSRECVEHLARAEMKNSRADYAAAVSGIAGPDGGTAEKPVGTIWIAAASQTEVVSEALHFNSGRQANRERAKNAALHLLWRLINKPR